MKLIERENCREHMKLEIIKSHDYEPSKLEKIHASSRVALRKFYRPKEGIRFDSPKPLKEERLVVKHDGLEVATTKLHYYQNRLHVLGLGVLDAYRSKGICRLMIDCIVNESKRTGKPCVSLYTIRETGHVELFNKLGFVVKVEEQTEDFISDSYDVLHEVYMELEL